MYSVTCLLAAYLRTSSQTKQNLITAIIALGVLVGVSQTVTAATFTVTNLNDVGAGSLRQAIVDANSLPGDDTINFQNGLSGTITLASGELLVSSNVTISGPGADVLSVSANLAFRLFNISANATVAINHLTITRGRTQEGGGLLNAGTLTISNSKIIDNECGGGDGGGIANRGSLLVSNTSLSNNICVAGLGLDSKGGGISNRGSLTVISSTLSSNSANRGGGIANLDAGVLSIRSSTIFANRARMNGSGIFGTFSLSHSTVANNSVCCSNPTAGGIEGNGSIYNSIVANNFVGSTPTPANTIDVKGAVVSQGHNLISSTNGSSGWIGSDLLNQPAYLAPFGDYGGPTFTTGLFQYSPAINAGNNADAPATDQRGSPRLIGSRVDIGAYENNIVVSPPLMPNGVLGAPYTQTLSAVRLNNLSILSTILLPEAPDVSIPFTYSLLGGTLNPGLTLSSDGIISGTPTATGSYFFIIKATDSDGIASAVEHSLTVFCGYSIAPTNQSFTSAGGSGTIQVSTSDGCMWTAQTTESWIQITGGGSGTGNGAVQFSVQPNTDSARTGAITVGGQTFTINQAGGCGYALSSTSANLPSNGGNRDFSVNTGNGCLWTATSNAPWITITSGTGSGTGTVSFSVQANTGSARTGTVSVAGQTFTVNQAPLCSYSLSSAGTNFPASGGSGSFTLTAFDGCTWNATSDSPWLTVNSGSGNGNGSVTFTVQPNVQPPRSGIITVGSQTFTVSQQSGCTYSLSSSSVSISSNGGTSIFNINSGAGCIWTAQSNSLWVTITSGSSGSGSGVVSYSVQPNPGAFRTATVTAGGQSYIINQAPLVKTSCDFDGDGKTDLSIFRPSGTIGSEWWWLRSSNGTNGAVQFGMATDKLAPVDFTGDGKTDVAFWRPSSGEWFVLRSEDFSFYAFPFGATGDVPVPADYDGDGKADAAVFRESAATWYINKSSGGTDIVGFGAAGDKPVNADYDGDGKSDIAIFRPSGANGAEWWVRRSSNASVFALQFGTSTDKAVPGDFTGDGKADVAFWRPATGFWNILRSEDFSYYAFPFGANGDVASPGDYDGDGKLDAAVFRPSSATWFASRSTAGVLIQQFGIAGDVPVPNAFVR